MWTTSVIISRVLRFCWNNLFKWDDWKLSVVANISCSCNGTMCNSQEVFRILTIFFLAVLCFVFPAEQYIFHSLAFHVTSFHSSIPYLLPHLLELGLPWAAFGEAWKRHHCTPTHPLSTCQLVLIQAVTYFLHFHRLKPKATVLVTKSYR